MIMDMNKAKMVNDAVTATAVRVAREEAKEEAKEEEKIEIALNMLEKGLPLDVIADVTGLPVAKLENLRKS